MTDAPVDGSPRDRTRTWLPIAAAAGIVALVLAVVFLVGGHRVNYTSATGTLICPRTYQQQNSSIWVPSAPNNVATTKRLTPDVTPQHAVACSYAYSTTTARLAGSRVLTGSLAGVATSLAYTAPPAAIACSADATEPRPDYLLGLTYGKGTLWVSVPGRHCEASASNGAFVAGGDVGAYVDAAYRARHWVTDPAGTLLGPCGAAGRLGAQTTLVPGTPTTLHVCVGPRLVRTVPATRAKALVTALNALPTVAAVADCQDAHPRPGYDDNLIFGYRRGPSVAVTLDRGCFGPVENGYLRATRLGSVRTLLARL